MIHRLLLAAAALVCSAGLAAAAVPPAAGTPPQSLPAAAGTAAAPAPASSAPPALDAQDLRGFFDSLVPYMLKRNGIAGGVVSVVKDGHVIFAQGYGYADVAKRTPVVADKTLFRIGSTSKLFTWTSVMQLVGEGKIDLDRDVNDYLDFKIPPRFGKPITVRDLMTMTPGFAESIHGLMAPSTDKLTSLRAYLVSHVPPRIFPPGKVVAYSNYGAALAGYIVQRVSGEPFNDYVQDHILKPLGMAHSTFAQPLPPVLRKQLATGYITAHGKTIVPFEPVQPWPAGSMTSSATDMAKFMIAQLQDGQYQGTSILSPATIKLMHSHQYSAAPGINGYDLGLYQENRNGLRIIGHGGDTIAFHTDLHLLLNQDVGVFMSFNSAGKAPNGSSEGVRTQLFRAFLDRYFPYAAPHEETVASPKPDAARVAGWYEASRRIESTFSVLQVLTQSSVTANPDGTIRIEALKDLSGTPRTWREVGPLTYREVGGQSHTKFVADKNGNVRYWISDDFLPVELFQPVHGLRSSGMLKSVGVLFLLTLVLTLVIWVGGWIVRRRFRSPLLMSPAQRRWRLASRVGVVVLLFMMGGWFYMISSGLEDTDSAIGHWLTALYMLGVLAALGAIAMLIEAVLRVLHGPGGWLVRLGEMCLGLSALYGLWVILAYGFASFNYTY